MDQNWKVEGFSEGMYSMASDRAYDTLPTPSDSCQKIKVILVADVVCQGQSWSPVLTDKRPGFIGGIGSMRSQSK